MMRKIWAVAQYPFGIFAGIALGSFDIEEGDTGGAPAGAENVQDTGQAGDSNPL